MFTYLEFEVDDITYHRLGTTPPAVASTSAPGERWSGTFASVRHGPHE
ncbi:hypothetical protein [Dactylosporangium sp. NPDC049140]